MEIRLVRNIFLWIRNLWMMCFASKVWFNIIHMFVGLIGGSIDFGLSMIMRLELGMLSYVLLSANQYNWSVKFTDGIFMIFLKISLFFLLICKYISELWSYFMKGYLCFMFSKFGILSLLLLISVIANNWIWSIILVLVLLKSLFANRLLSLIIFVIMKMLFSVIFGVSVWVVLILFIALSVIWYILELLPKGSTFSDWGVTNIVSTAALAAFGTLFLGSCSYAFYAKFLATTELQVINYNFDTTITLHPAHAVVKSFFNEVLGFSTSSSSTNVSFSEEEKMEVPCDVLKDFTGAAIVSPTDLSDDLSELVMSFVGRDWDCPFILETESVIGKDIYLFGFKLMENSDQMEEFWSEHSKVGIIFAPFATRSDDGIIESLVLDSNLHKLFPGRAELWGNFGLMSTGKICVLNNAVLGRLIAEGHLRPVSDVLSVNAAYFENLIPSNKMFKYYANSSAEAFPRHLFISFDEMWKRYTFLRLRREVLNGVISVDEIRNLAGMRGSDSIGLLHPERLTLGATVPKWLGVPDERFSLESKILLRNMNNWFNMESVMNRDFSIFNYNSRS